jgi:hypothetical protein
MKTVIKVFTLVCLVAGTLSASIVGGWKVDSQMSLENSKLKDKKMLLFAMTVLPSLDIYDN